MNILHLVKVYFWRSPAWDQEKLNKRFRFFAEHTLKSLQAQTFQDFRIWFHCGPDMAMMVDELRNVAPSNSLFSFGNNITPLLLPSNHSHVYVTRLDSDDLYAPDALELAHAIRPRQGDRVECSMFSRGYLYDTIQKRLGVYCNPSSPFHTVMWPIQDFTDPQRYVSKFVGDHSKVRSAYPVHSLPDWRFTVLVHDSNTTTTFDYSAEPTTPVERGWTIERFMRQPVVFDVDDFCDEWNCLPDLLELRRYYPNFKATLFTIPGKTSLGLLRQVKTYHWLEVAVHGINHTDNELVGLSRATLRGALDKLDYSLYTRGFRPPFWQLTREMVQACNDVGLWMAVHLRDVGKGQACNEGYYVCNGRNPYWHGHTHDVCDNWLHAALPDLIKRWPPSQAFSFVSEAVLVPQK